MNPTENSAKKTGDARKENLENEVFIWYNFCQEIRVKFDLCMDQMKIILVLFLLSFFLQAKSSSVPLLKIIITI